VREAVRRVAARVGDREERLEHAPRAVHVAAVHAVCAREDELSRGGGGRGLRLRRRAVVVAVVAGWWRTQHGGVRRQ
jgi:hypothetical protein